eukprot:CAMPEP_0176416696 /NCGR_PEP_ID=MMETSP0127-20121128/6484_1 /TAXON_ID=938130 /ORGANISM="Platyophrya macrostoma, Strain WH" /LENGTH=246 /DNA_ID=CAMNT_0017796789 /DNA_START=85 /DNA_END=821 /DNA_ORIENTATION=+
MQAFLAATSSESCSSRGNGVPRAGPHHHPFALTSTDGDQEDIHVTSCPTSSTHPQLMALQPHSQQLRPAHPPPSRRRHSLGNRSVVLKLVLFAGISLAILLLVFFGPPWPGTTLTTPPRAAQRQPDGGAPSLSKLSRPDAYVPSSPPQAASMDQYTQRFFANAPPTICPEAVWSREDIRRHALMYDLWIVIQGAVLNVTRFVSVHPGGRAIFDGAAEDDAAAVFAQFHSPSTLSLLSSFCIGRVAP